MRILMTPEKYMINKDEISRQEIHLYQWKMKSILYIFTIIQLNIAYIISKLFEFLQNSFSHHLAAADQTIVYLYVTKTLIVEFSAHVSEKQVFTCASDAVFSNDMSIQRSSEDFLFQLFENLIDWHAMKQKTVTTLSTEAKFLALSHAAKEIYWWKCLFRCIQMNPDHDTAVTCNNQQTICLLTEDTGKFSTKLCHVNIHRHWLHQEVQKKHLQIDWLPTAEMPADSLTKTLPCQKHENFIKLLGLVDISKHLENLIDSH